MVYPKPALTCFTYWLVLIPYLEPAFTFLSLNFNSLSCADLNLVFNSLPLTLELHYINRALALDIQLAQVDLSCPDLDLCLDHTFP